VNLPKSVAGVAILVLAAFWGFLLIDLIPAIGYLMVLTVPFVVLFAMGAYVVFDGLGGFSVRPKAGSRTGRNLGALDLAILELMAQRKSSDAIAETTGVSSSVVADKVQRLTEAGYLAQGSLSEKGFEALRAQVRT
jgi:hypothetical protein